MSLYLISHDAKIGNPDKYVNALSGANSRTIIKTHLWKVLFKVIFCRARAAVACVQVQWTSQRYSHSSL